MAILSALIPSRAVPERAAATMRPRHGFFLRWLLRLLVCLGALQAVLIGVIAIPASRNFVIDQIVYQGDFFFPTHQRATVIRYVHKGNHVVSVTVHVLSGTTPGGSFVSSALHGAVRTYRAYLPPGYFAPANRGRRYPVLYLIHGSPGNPGSWLRGAHAAITANEDIAAGTVAPLIMVMPDVNGGPLRDTECVNKYDGTDNEMTYFVKDLVPYIDAHYRTIPLATGRAIGGLSSGGYCAYNIGLHFPGVFNQIFSISGYFHALPSEVFGLNDPFGHNHSFLAANSPDVYVNSVPGVRHMHLIIADSTADFGYTGYALNFDRLLTRLRVPHVLLLHKPTGFHLWDHSWAYWSSAFRQVLPALSSNFGH